jgi:uncharacterized membrane protein
MADAVASPWARWGALGLSLAGLAVSTYLAVEHYSAASTLACPETGLVNCQKVTTSPESIVIGVPVAVWGLAFFTFLVAVTAPPAWRAEHVWLDRIRVGLSFAGVASVMYLIYVELFVIDAVCLWCTVVHLLTIALFAVLVMDLARRPDTVVARR